MLRLSGRDAQLKFRPLLSITCVIRSSVKSRIQILPPKSEINICSDSFSFASAPVNSENNSLAPVIKPVIDESLKSMPVYDSLPETSDIFGNTVDAECQIAMTAMCDKIFPPTGESICSVHSQIVHEQVHSSS